MTRNGPTMPELGMKFGRSVSSSLPSASGLPSAWFSGLRGQRRDSPADQLPHLGVPAKAVRAWQEREPQTWAMVCDWLASNGRG